MTCGKREYATKAQAKRALGRLQSLRGGEATSRRAYRCPDCGWWHLTSSKTSSSVHRRTVIAP